MIQHCTHTRSVLDPEEEGAVEHATVTELSRAEDSAALLPPQTAVSHHVTKRVPFARAAQRARALARDCWPVREGLAPRSWRLTQWNQWRWMVRVGNAVVASETAVAVAAAVKLRAKAHRQTPPLPLDRSGSTVNRGIGLRHGSNKTMMHTAYQIDELSDGGERDSVCGLASHTVAELIALSMKRHKHMLCD